MRIAPNLNVNMHGIGLRAAGRKTLVMMQPHIIFLHVLILAMAAGMMKVIIIVVTLTSRFTGLTKKPHDDTMMLLSPAVYACVLLAGVRNFSGLVA